jgi:hypothetical protein
VATTLTFLTPLGVLLALGALVPLAALFVVRRRAERVRRNVGLPRARLRRLLVPVAALVGSAALLGLSASQPVLEQTSPREVRTDVEAYFVVDISRSMLAQNGVGSPTRLERAKIAASDLRASLPDIRIGIASMTDRALPHLFPSSDADVFQATLERSLGIERPPPRESIATLGTDLDALRVLRSLRFFSPASKKKLVVVFTDGESLPVSSARLGSLFLRPPAIDTIFVQFWGEEERVFTRGTPEPEYLPDPTARTVLDGLAASTRGRVFDERSAGAVTATVRDLLGSGPTVTEGEVRGRFELAPILAAAAFLPLGLLLWRRDR